MIVLLLTSALLACGAVTSQDYPNYDTTNQNYDNSGQQQQSYNTYNSQQQTEQPATASSAYSTSTAYDQNNNYQTSNQVNYDNTQSRQDAGGYTGYENTQTATARQDGGSYTGYAPASGYAANTQGYVNSYAQGPAQVSTYSQTGYAQAPAQVSSYSQTGYGQAPAQISTYSQTGYAQAQQAPAQVSTYSQTGYAPATGYTQGGYVTNYAPATGYVQNYAPQTYAQPAPVAYDPAPVYNQVKPAPVPVSAPVQVQKAASVGCGVTGPVKDVVVDVVEKSEDKGFGGDILGLRSNKLILDPNTKPLGILSKAVQQSLANTRAGIQNGIKGISNIAAAGINLQTGIIGALQAIPVKAINAVAIATNNLANLGRTAGDALLSRPKTTTLAGGILAG